MSYDQARWTADEERYEPLLAEKGLERVRIGAGGGDDAGDGEESAGGDGDDGADAVDRRTGDGGDTPLPDDLTRDALELPAVAEPQVDRHYTHLAQQNYGVDSGPIPLGSCTMKYNPAFCDDLASHPDAAVHPDRPDRTIQGTLAVAHALQDSLARIGGMDAVSLQPPAGAAGEFAGVLVARAYHEDRGEDRSEVIVPASAHGTNFASAAMAGYDVVELPSDEDGRVDLAALEAAVGPDTAALMLTNPNTLGLFERDIERIAETVHDAGGLLYYDGANLNALLGRARPGDMGFDVMHYNVHKTFAVPHGGGGPGAGPIGVVDDLAPYLPAPRVRESAGGGQAADGRDQAAAGDGRTADEDAAPSGGRGFELFDPPSSIGKVHGFQGNWLALLRAYAYVARLGDEGLTDASAKAVLNANYLASRIAYEVPFGPVHHEFVASAGDQDAADVAKRMLDHGVHPPTTKWPEIVDEALMTEPTEVESKASLDRLADAFDAVADEDAETLARAPESTTARRIDQVDAAREPRLSWRDLEL